MRAAKKPCQSCPWIEQNRAEQIPAYNHERAEALSATCPDSRGFGPDFGAPVFACHRSAEGREIACAGWLAVAGLHHPLVRLGVIQGTIDPCQLQPDPSWPPLHPDFESLITKLRTTVGD